MEAVADRARRIGVRLSDCPQVSHRDEERPVPGEAGGPHTCLLWALLPGVPSGLVTEVTVVQSQCPRWHVLLTLRDQ